ADHVFNTQPALNLIHSIHMFLYCTLNLLTSYPRLDAYGLIKPMPPASPNMPTTPQPNDYSFILAPAAPPKQSLFPGNSPAGRLAVVLGVLLVLVIIFVIIKGLLGGSSNQPALTSVAQDQQEIIHLVSSAGQGAQGQQISLSATNQ